MRLERILTYRLIRLFRLVIPILVIGLIAILSWNYWSHRVATRPPQTALELPGDLAVLSEGFSFSRTEEGRTLFTIRAQTNLGFKDNRSMLENVEVIVYGDTAADPARRIRSLHCNYNQQSGDIYFSGNVEVELDERTHGRTDELTYNHRDRMITTDTKTFLEQPGTMKAEADALEYRINTALLRLVGNVIVVSSQGSRLETGAALVERADNRITLTDGLVLESRNGRVQGPSGTADLEPGTLQPRIVVVEGGATAESSGQNSHEAWNLRADWLKAFLSSSGNAERVEARGDVQLEKTAPETKQSLTGSEVDAALDADGNVQLLEARTGARMVMGGDRTLTSNKIRTSASGSVFTEGASVLEMGDARIEGTQFTISQGDIVTFKTPNRAQLRSGGRRTSAEQTEARFDSRTNMFLEMVQTGRFEFQEGTLSGQAQSANLADAGSIITLEGLPSVWDAEKRIEANRIVLNQTNNSFVATQNVKTITKNADEPVLVTADRAEGNADTIVYMDSVKLWRGATWIAADKLEASPKENRYHARGSVQSMMGAVRASSDELDYDELQRVAHYTGSVHAQKQNMLLATDDMTVKAKGDEVSEIIALGNVALRRAGRHATGEKAIYDATAETVILTGRNARFVDEIEGLVEGPTLVVYTSGDRMAVKSDGPQRTISKHKVKN